MAQSPRRVAVNNAGHAEKPAPTNELPSMTRFKTLTKRLLKVSRDEVQEAERAFAARKEK
jgi:hypothetical protein